VTSPDLTAQSDEARALSRQRRKRFVFKIVTLLSSTLVCVSLLLGIDLYLHHKHGINLRGYRGPTLGRKQPGEKRIAILGGSTTWGFGLQAGQDFPAQLQRMLAESPDFPHQGAINIANLGSNNEGAYSFKFTLKDYAYLDSDMIILYSGYNDLETANNTYIFRHRSPVFVWTGYLPLLPSLTVDKWTVWKRQLTGNDRKTIFQPPDPKKIDTTELQKQVGALTENGPAPGQSNGGGCPPEWEFYCQQISETVEQALQQAKTVLVVTEPYISDRHVAQQQALRAMLEARFSNQTRFAYLNLGRTVDLRDPALCWDGMHLTEEGNRRIAAAMVRPVSELLRR
jgi:lysophospholipase L1-like esterase